jgi:hypothetical protein
MSYPCEECGLPYNGYRGDGIGSCNCSRCYSCDGLLRWRAGINGLCEDCDTWCGDCRSENCGCYPDDDDDWQPRSVTDVATGDRL